MKVFCKILLSMVFVLVILATTSCYNTPGKKKEYYSNEENYIEVTGTIHHVVFDQENEVLCLAFSCLSEKLDDDNFELVGRNYSIIIESSYIEKIKTEMVATFVTAPKYFGDGYIMPIVALTIDGQCLLDYETGIANFLDYLNS